MEIDKDIAVWGAGTMVAIATAVTGYFVRRNDKRLDEQGRDIDDLREDHSDCKIELANFKTEVAHNYAKESTIARLHERIDEGFGELRADIKTLLSKVK